jgi:hypothetical protein
MAEEIPIIAKICAGSVVQRAHHGLALAAIALRRSTLGGLPSTLGGLPSTLGGMTTLGGSRTTPGGSPSTLKGLSSTLLAHVVTTFT